MKIPKNFRLGGTSWKVEEALLLTAMGLSTNTRALIQLDKDLSKEVKEQTFCHELVHAVLYSMGKPSDQHDEVFVDGFATFLHQYLTQHGK